MQTTILYVQLYENCDQSGKNSLKQPPLEIPGPLTLSSMGKWGGEIRRISLHKNRDQTLKNAYTKSTYTKISVHKNRAQTLNAYTETDAKKCVHKISIHKICVH